MWNRNKSIEVFSYTFFSTPKSIKVTKKQLTLDNKTKNPIRKNTRTETDISHNIIYESYHRLHHTVSQYGIMITIFRKNTLAVKKIRLTKMKNASTPICDTNCNHWTLIATITKDTKTLQWLKIILQRQIYQQENSTRCVQRWIIIMQISYLRSAKNFY